MLQFDITGLAEGDVLEETRTPSAGQLDLDPEQFSDIEVSVRLQKIDERVEVTFDARATATLQGDRTLRWYDEPVSDSFALTFKPPREITEEEVSTDTVRELPASTSKIDITKEVRDTLLLALPIRRIAPGGEEEEIQLEFGTLEGDDGEEPSDVPDWKKKLRDLRENTGDE